MKTHQIIVGFISFLAVLLLSACSEPVENELVIYSSRKLHLVEPIAKAFTDETGIKVTLFTDKAPALIQRIKAEGSKTKADILLTVDAGNLWHATNEGLFIPYDSEKIDRIVPAHLRDSAQHWTGLSLRARTLVYHTERVKAAELSTYQSLASSAWKKRILLRSSSKVYTQSLTSMLISELGEFRTEYLLRNWVDNLAQPVFHSDTKIMEAILAGKGDIGIVNTYYFGRLKQKDPSLPLSLFWPNQDSFGVHVNVSGAGILEHAKHPKAALQFLEWAVSPEAQALFAGLNLEYPVNPKAALDPLVKSWGEFKQNETPLSEIGERQPQAIELMKRVNYN